TWVPRSAAPAVRVARSCVALLLDHTGYYTQYGGRTTAVGCAAEHGGDPVLTSGWSAPAGVWWYGWRRGPVRRLDRKDVRHRSAPRGGGCGIRTHERLAPL